MSASNLRGNASAPGSMELNASVGMLGERGERLVMRSGDLQGDDLATASTLPGAEGIREESSENSDEPLPRPPSETTENEIPVSSIFVHNTRRNPQTAAFYDEHAIDASSIPTGDGPFRDEGMSVQMLLSGAQEGARAPPRPVNISELNMVSRSRGQTLSAGVRTPHQAQNFLLLRTLNSCCQQL